MRGRLKAREITPPMYTRVLRKPVSRPPSSSQPPRSLPRHGNSREREICLQPFQGERLFVSYYPWFDSSVQYVHCIGDFEVLLLGVLIGWEIAGWVLLSSRENVSLYGSHSARIMGGSWVLYRINQLCHGYCAGRCDGMLIVNSIVFMIVCGAWWFISLRLLWRCRPQGTSWMIAGDPGNRWMCR